uniref:Uncharacterized protein n=1 Tax=Cucumis melo TaxID=3656 RepID=A0A9I9DG90_CUCME
MSFSSLSKIQNSHFSNLKTPISHILLNDSKTSKYHLQWPLPLQQQTSNTSHPPKPRAGRKPGPKNPNQKKPPQRGLGVAQLERLRLQENWKTVTEISPPTFLLHNTLPNFPLHFPPAPPPILHTDCIAAGAGAVLGFDHHGFVVQRIGNNGGFLPAGGVLIGNTSVRPPESSLQSQNCRWRAIPIVAIIASRRNESTSATE